MSTSATASQADKGADDDEAEVKPGKPLRVERLLANLGYGKRKECTVMIKRKKLVFADTGQPAKVIIRQAVSGYNCSSGLSALPARRP